MRKVFALVLALGLVFPGTAFGTGDVIGKFGISEAPEITGLNIYTDLACTIPATSLTPQQKYYIKIDVTDNDGIASLKGLDVRMWYDSEGAEQSGSVLDSIDSYQPDEMIAIYWWNDQDVLNFVGGSGTWELDHAQVVKPENPDPEETSFSFIIPLTVGKLAQETSGNAKWQLGVKAYDQFAQTCSYFSNAGIFGLPMNWYGEIVVESGTEVDWGGIPANTRYYSPQARQVLSEKISYLSNGSYGEQVKADNLWYLIGGDMVNEYVTRVESVTADDTFGLKIGNTDDHAQAAILDGDGDVFVTVRSGIERAIAEGVTEVANIADDYYLFIELAPVFSSGAYSGNITFGIFNDNQ